MYCDFACASIRKAVNDYRELKLLLDMYKGVGKEQRDKVQLMAAEKKARQEVEELKAQVRYCYLYCCCCWDYYYHLNFSNSEAFLGMVTFIIFCIIFSVNRCYLI